MRILIPLTIGLALAAPAAAQRLGARTTSPTAMAAELQQVGPEEELRALIAAAEAHPLGTIENPVRVGGPDGERAYLQRLRCPNGVAPLIGDRSNAGVGAFGSVVTAYQLACGDSRYRIVFDIYHEEHVETRAPANLTLGS
jgi:hypothetical protein